MYSPHSYLETHHWLKGAVLLGMAPETFAGRKVYSGYGSAKNARTYMTDCIKRNVPEFKIPKDDRDLIFKGWEALCEKFARPFFFEKSPQLLAHWAGLSLLMEWMEGTKFKVRIIGLTRNPMSVQYSAFQLFHTDPKRRQYGWLEIQKNMLALRSLLLPEDFYHVKYEDVIQQPGKTFAAVCDFIGILKASEMGSQVHSGSLTKWKDDPYFDFQLDPIVKQIAVGFGYSEKELDNPYKPEPPVSYRFRRRWEKLYTLSRTHLMDRLIKPLLMSQKWQTRKHFLHDSRNE
jgi:hypothetical protein